jgi:hypothetical protein
MQNLGLNIAKETSLNFLELLGRMRKPQTLRGLPII